MRFKAVEGVAHLGYGLATNPGQTLSETWTGLKQWGSEVWEIAKNPVQTARILGDFALENPKAFMRGLGKASGDVVIADATGRATSPLIKPITATTTKAVMGGTSRLMSRISESAVGRTATRVVSEAFEQAGTKLSSAVESVSQRTTALKQSIGETFQKLRQKWDDYRASKSETPRRNQADPPVEYIEEHPNFVELEQQLKDAPVDINPNELNFSQKTAGSGGRTAKLRESMKEGWDYSREPVDVIQTENSLVTFDNTRVGIAQELGLDKIQARIHAMDDPLPAWFAQQRNLIYKAKKNKLPVPKTWGDALKIRLKDNGIKTIDGLKKIDLKEE